MELEVVGRIRVAEKTTDPFAGERRGRVVYFQNTQVRTDVLWRQELLHPRVRQLGGERQVHQQSDVFRPDGRCSIRRTLHRSSPHPRHGCEREKCQGVVDVLEHELSHTIVDVECGCRRQGRGFVKARRRRRRVAGGGERVRDRV